MNNIACRLRGVSKTYGTGETAVHAVKQVDLDIYQGELFMIMGPSGSGKTTLLSLLGGTLYCDSGTIDVFGTPIHTLSPEQLTEFRRTYVGFIFQQFHLVPTLTAWENVALPLLIQGKKRQDAYAVAQQKLELVNLAHMGERFPRNLSGGEQQRLAIARALIHEPRLVISDEPTSNLDLETGTKIMNVLKTIAKDTSRTVVIVTHDPRIVQYGDRMVQMSDGRILPSLASDGLEKK